MNKTPNFALNQWESTDRILMADFNADNAKIDAALAAQAAAVAKCGNCRIETFSYTGKGTYGDSAPTYFQFSKKPLLFFVRGPQSLLVGSNLCSTATAFVYDSVLHGAAAITDLPLTWSGTKAALVSSAQAAVQMNTSGQTYWVFALAAEDA